MRVFNVEVHENITRYESRLELLRELVAITMAQWRAGYVLMGHDDTPADDFDPYAVHEDACEDVQSAAFTFWIAVKQYCSEYHSGMSSPEYGILSFVPVKGETDIDDRDNDEPRWLVMAFEEALHGVAPAYALRNDTDDALVAYYPQFDGVNEWYMVAGPRDEGSLADLPEVMDHRTPEQKNTTVLVRRT